MEPTIYSRLIEAEEKDNSGEETAIHMMKHEKKLKNYIWKLTNKCRNIIGKEDVEDIFMNAVTYAMTHGEYDINKAYNEESNRVASIDEYASMIVKYCTMKYMKKEVEHDGPIVPVEKTDKNGKVIDEYENQEDTRSQDYIDALSYEMRSICKQYESSRYIDGIDIFMLWFIRLETILQCKEDKYKKVLEIIGVTKSDTVTAEKHSKGNEIMKDIAKAVSISGIDKALNIIGEYTYAKEYLHKLVCEA